MVADLILWKGNVFPDIDCESIFSEVGSNEEWKTDDGCYTTFFERGYRPETVLVNFYREILTIGCKDLGIMWSDFTFEFWCQVYDGHHTIHNHFSPVIPLSFVHFIKPVDEYFNFIDSNGNKSYPTQQPGDLIIFPSWAPHSIDPSYGNQRAVIAGNITFSTMPSPCGTITYQSTTVRPGLLISERINGTN